MVQESVNCPICHGKSYAKFDVQGYWINQCEICGHQFVDISEVNSHVEQVYGDAYFMEGGAGYPDYIAEKEILLEHGRRYAGILDKYMDPGMLLDIGCAAGFISKGFEECGWATVGVEPNESMADFGRDVLGLHIESVKFEDFNQTLKFDLVCMIQVVSHFVDVSDAFERASRLTKPGGFLLVETWDRESLLAKILGSSWHEYNPPSVLHWFSISHLREILSMYDFKEVAYGRPRKKISLAHAISIVNYKVQESSLAPLSSLLRWMQNLNIHIPYPGNDVFWAIFRKVDTSFL